MNNWKIRSASFNITKFLNENHSYQNVRNRTKIVPYRALLTVQIFHALYYIIDN